MLLSAKRTGDDNRPEWKFLHSHRNIAPAFPALNNELLSNLHHNSTRRDLEPPGTTISNLTKRLPSSAEFCGEKLQHLKLQCGLRSNHVFKIFVSHESNR